MSTNPSTPLWTLPPAQINSVAISDDGQKCVYGSSYERGKGYFYTYLYDNQGHRLWKKSIAKDQSTYQGVFWVDISGDGAFVASGGETVNPKDDPSYPTPGFLQMFVASTGEIIHSSTYSARINQVSLSQNGQYLAVCYGHSLEVFQLNDSQDGYTSIYTYTSKTYNINSCVISRDGHTVVAAGIAYADDAALASRSKMPLAETITTGQVFSFSVNDGVVSKLAETPTSTGCMRVAIVESGLFWAASLHDGSCVMYGLESFGGIPTVKQYWQFKPDNPNLELAYAVDITQTEFGDIFVACGANLHAAIPGTDPGGILYLLQAVRLDYEDNQAEDVDYPPPNYSATLKWSTNIKYGVNPGVSMDRNATYVTATDGKPVGQTVVESSGNFYMYEVATGSQLFQQPTFMMNWPMKLSRDGLQAIGASDDGAVYYWQAPYHSAGQTTATETS